MGMILFSAHRSPIGTRSKRGLTALSARIPKRSHAMAECACDVEAAKDGE
jgi:hypothetical protein